MVEIMQAAQHMPMVGLNTPLDEVQEQLGQTSSRVAAVYEGRYFRGLITLDDIDRMWRRLSVKRSPGWEPAR
ncbi:MAG: hypothetical protein AB1801_13435 [Chloroflexota bacterium]